MCPLEPSLPRARLEGMLDAAGVSIVIVDGGALGRVPRTRATMIDLDADRVSIAGQSSENPSVRVHGENLAYVVFTSGTTGRPKGVMVSHRSLLAAAAAWEDAYDLRRPPLRHLQVAGFAFDVFTGDWVRALTTGGTLVACPRPVSLDPAALADLIRRERIECLELVPALAERPGDAPRAARPKTWAGSGCWPSAPTPCAAVCTVGCGGWWDPAGEWSTPTG